MTVPPASWLIGDGEVDLKPGALVGIINVTPDSFSDGGEHFEPGMAIAHGLEMISQGAALVDVGGESTHPGAEPVSEPEELRRLMPVVEGLVAEGVRVSADTRKPGVARRALSAGAVVINDVTGFSNPEMIEVVADSSCGVVAMHMRGTPVDMQADPQYDDVVAEIEDFLLSRARDLQSAGVDPKRIAIDPGIGFGKLSWHNHILLAHIDRLAAHGMPVMVGTSRKRFLGELVAEDTRSSRDLVTAITTALGFASGARLFRVHDVAGSGDALRVSGAIVANQGVR